MRKYKTDGEENNPSVVNLVHKLFQTFPISVFSIIQSSNTCLSIMQRSSISFFLLCRVLFYYTKFQYLSSLLCRVKIPVFSIMHRSNTCLFFSIQSYNTVYILTINQSSNICLFDLLLAG